MPRDWNKTDLMDPCVLINYSRHVYESQAAFLRAKHALDACKRFSETVYAAIRMKIKREHQGEKLTVDDLNSLVLMDEDWAKEIAKIESYELAYIEAKIVFDKHDLKWKSIQSGMSLMKTEMSITKVTP